MIALQDPIAPSVTENLVATLQALGWVDKTALAVLLVFFVLGLFKGLIWQVSRIGILVAAYVVAGRFGRDVAIMLGASEQTGAATPLADANTAAGAGGLQLPQGEPTLYVAYCLLFVAVLIVLSLLAMLIKKLADRAGLGFFDRLGGGVLGVATGACVVLAGVFGINMFFPSSQLAEAAGESHSLRWSQQAIGWLGEAVDDDLRSVLALQPLGSQAGLQDPNGAGTGEGRPLDGLPGNNELPRMPSALPLPEGMKLEGSNGEPGPSPGAEGAGSGSDPKAGSATGNGNGGNR